MARNRYSMCAAATAGRVAASLAWLALAGASWNGVGIAAAGELVDRNPFDPQRKPWKAPPPTQPELPALTPQDLQIEAIVAFGAMQGIVAQLDGKLRGSLPSNAAGKVRIRVGQSFGAGYVLESIAADQAVVLGGSTRYTIPVLRRASRGSAPMPATLATEPRAAPHAAFVSEPISSPAALPVAPPPPVGSATGAAPAPLQFAPPSPPPPPPAPMQAAGGPAIGGQVSPSAAQTPPQQPMSLLEAIQAAQAAARNQQGSAPPVMNPFAVPKK